MLDSRIRSGALCNVAPGTWPHAAMASADRMPAGQSETAGPSPLHRLHTVARGGGRPARLVEMSKGRFAMARKSSRQSDVGATTTVSTAAGDPVGAWSNRRLALVVFLIVAGLRLAANLWFAHAYGRFASPNPEIWFYLGVAEQFEPAIYHLSSWDPTTWLLRLLGLGFSGDGLYTAILIAGSLSMALASVALALAARTLSGSGAAGLAAGLFYAVTPWTYGASLGGFTHDTVGLALAAAAIWALSSAGTPGRGVRAARWAWLALVVLLIFGLRIGPTALAVVVVVLVTLLTGMLGRRLGPARSTLLVGGGVVVLTTILLAIAAWRPGTTGPWVGWVWDQLAAAAESQRGLDIVLQSRQGSADVLPGRPLGLLHPYPLALIVAACTGVVFAWRHRRLEPLLLLGVGAIGFCVGQRGIRIVDLGLALGAGLAFAGMHGWVGDGGSRAVPRPRGRRRRTGRHWPWALLPAGLALLATLGAFRFQPSLALVGLVVTSGLVWVGLGRWHRLRDLMILLAFGLLVWRAQQGMAEVIAVDNTHVEALREVAALERSQPEEQILAASWDLGYMIGAVSGRPPAAHPQAINVSKAPDGENDARIFWSPPTAAAAEAARRGIRFLFLGTRDFSILEEFPAEDRFRVRRRLGFQVPTMSGGGKKGPLPLSIVRQLLIYRLINDPERLKAWRLVTEATSPRSGELLRLFELVEPPDPERTYVFAILDNPTATIQESEVQLFHDPTAAGATGHRGARLKTRVRPYYSTMSIFSFLEVVDGKGRAEISNELMGPRLVAHMSGGRYAVDFVRPRRGWRPLEAP